MGVLDGLDRIHLVVFVITLSLPDLPEGALAKVPPRDLFVVVENILVFDP